MTLSHTQNDGMGNSLYEFTVLKKIGIPLPPFTFRETIKVKEIIEGDKE
jgi:hypothetical protein